ncbi:MAG: AAA family ATPase [Methylotenera sp.]|nr:AAA family ATPase [Methylotenera sp.]
MATDFIAKSKKELGFSDNKLIPIESIKAIEIENFRSFKNRTVELGTQITVLVGRNGTMKTSLMGLIAHPFSSISKDAFGGELKTTLKEVFRLSEKYDDKSYSYKFVIQLVDNDTFLSEEVKIYYIANKTNRHRIVVSGSEKGDGNFTYNTSFLNLKRLLPLVDTMAAPDLDESLKLSAGEREQQIDFYETVLPSTEYSFFAPIHEKGLKTTFAPTGKSAKYDYEAISSGEDNLGAIFNRLVGFQRAFTKGQEQGNGVFCIDEFESSLHPVAQLRLFDYLYRWADQYKVQVVITTRSLHLIQNLYFKHKSNLDAKRIILNFVSCASAGNDKNYQILQNPEYQLAYKELTLETPVSVLESQKIDIFCEDDLAISYIKKLVKKREILKLVSFHSNLNQDSANNGTSYTSLSNLCKNFSLLLQYSFVIFDADVGVEVTNGIKDKSTYLVLPDTENLAIERRIICFILELENDSLFFQKFNEKTWFLDQMKLAGIKRLTVNNVKNEKVVKIDHCKKWVNADLARFKQYLSYYCDYLEGREQFVKLFIKKINLVNKRKGLPLLSE